MVGIPSIPLMEELFALLGNRTSEIAACELVSGFQPLTYNLQRWLHRLRGHVVELEEERCSLGVRRGMLPECRSHDVAFTGPAKLKSHRQVRHRVRPGENRIQVEVVL